MQGFPRGQKSRFGVAETQKKQLLDNNKHLKVRQVVYIHDLGFLHCQYRERELQGAVFPNSFSCYLLTKIR